MEVRIERGRRVLVSCLTTGGARRRGKGVGLGVTVGGGEVDEMGDENENDEPPLLLLLFFAESFFDVGCLLLFSSSWSFGLTSLLALFLFFVLLLHFVEMLSLDGLFEGNERRELARRDSLSAVGLQTSAAIFFLPKAVDPSRFKSITTTDIS